MNFNEIFEYRDGKLFWKAKPSQAVSIGDEAGSATGQGYLQVNVKGKSYQVHRVVYEMAHGYAPDIVDHINGDKLDNRIENLRAATKAQNRHNSKRPSTNTSGHKNVRWVTSVSRWRVSVTFGGKTRYFGHFVELNDAAQAAKLAREQVFGEFANHG